MASLPFQSLTLDTSGLTVRTRVFGGFGIVLLLLAGVAAVAKISITAISTKIAPIENAASLDAVSEAVSELASRHLETGRQINLYWATENSNEAEILRQQADKLSAQLEKLKMLPLREEQRTLTGQISSELATYLDIVGKIIQVTGGRRKAGDEANATGIVMTNASSAMLGRIEKENRTGLIPNAVRLAEAVEAGLIGTSRYVFTRDPADEDKAKVAFERAARELGRLKVGASGSERILRQLNALADALPAVRKSIGEIGSATAAAGAVMNQSKQQNIRIASSIQELRANAAAQHSADLNAVRAAAVWAGRLNLFLSAVALLAGTILAWFIGRGIAGPIQVMTAVMKQLAAGNHQVEVPYSGRGDEIGEMARTVEVFRRKSLDVHRLEAEKEQKHKAELQRAHTVDTLTKNFEATALGVADIVAMAADAMRSNTETMSANAGSTAQESETVAAASEHAASNVETVAFATEQLSATISGIAQQVDKASRMAADAMAEGQQTDSIVQELAASAGRIGEVVSLINGIATQTNLLALNATIEAARAGNAGKGFGVVANEVKSLAAQTAKSTGHISEEIEAIREAAGKAVVAIQRICATIASLNGISGAIAAAVTEQDATTQEIARNVQEAAADTKKMSNVIKRMSEIAKASGDTSSLVLSCSGELSAQAQQLCRQLQDFIAGVRAA